MSAVHLDLYDYVMAGYPAIVYRTSEERRALHECERIAKRAGAKFLCWSETNSMHDPRNENFGKTVEFKYNSEEYHRILLDGLNESKGSPLIFCLLDFHHFMKNPTTLRTAKDVFRLAKSRDVTFIFISERFEIPNDLEHEMVFYDLELPTKEQLEKRIHETIAVNERLGDISDEEVKKTAKALCGLTMEEAENALAVSIRKVQRLDLNIIYDIKKKTICQDNILEYYNSQESMDNVGGMQEFKEYAKERSFSAFSDEAQEYGLPYPKGVLLFGVPGCGKSLAAKALANMWEVPLLKLDLSKLFASLVGETESNTRKALRMAESMSPCVLWLDEVDKAIAGTASSGKTDSGVTSRMFGSILTWLQEKKEPVYVMATANSVNLPPEFYRKGRFDEIFFVNLPNLEERKEIWSIQIKKHKRNPENYDVEGLAIESEDYNGAEIEECIITAMYHAWNDGKRDYTTDDIKKAMKQLVPASQGIAKESVTSLREWSKSHGIRNASKVAKQSESDDSVYVSNNPDRVRRPAS